MASEAQAKLQALSEEFTKLQTELQTVVSSRQKLEAQKQENSGVKSEFGKLKDGEAIYKLVGPALLKQEKAEAEATVDGRLEFINKDITRQEDKIKEIQEKLERVKGDIIRIQTTAQSAAQGKQPAAAAGAAKA
ncbi:Prefoldin [Diaporthe sp. PMI_573]|nr:Prefoldin [Diaporthaceae sp. PMI_573]